MTAQEATLRPPGVRAVASAPLADAPFATAMVEVGRERPDVVVISADLSRYTDVAPFAPVAVTYAVFATRRAGEQVQMALATGSRTAVVAAFLPGLTTPFRATHQATDDLAIMRAVPGMTVIDPMDATE